MKSKYIPPKTTLIEQETDIMLKFGSSQTYRGGYTFDNYEGDQEILPIKEQSVFPENDDENFLDVW